MTAPEAAPAPPTALTAAPSSKTAILLKWSDNSDFESGVKLERSSPGETFTVVASLERDIVAYSDTGLVPNTRYLYRALAFNDVGNSEYSNVAEVILTAPGCQDAIAVSTDITAATTWSPGKKGCAHYHIVGDVDVRAALVVSPGTAVSFAQSSGLTISSGSLSAIGTTADTVRFAGDRETRGFWKGLRFNSNATSNELTYVSIAYAGGGTGDQAAVVVNGFDQLRLTHTVVEQSAGIGLLAESSAKLPGFAANTFRSNAGVGVRIPDHLVSALDVESSYVTGNGAAHIDVFGSGIDGGSAHTWRALGVPIRFTGTTTIFGALTLSPGLTVRFGPSASWTISGSLTAVGTAATPIQLVGDQPTRGYWNGLRFNSNAASNELTHVTVAYAGGGTGDQAAVVVDGFDQLLLSHSVIEQSAGIGLLAGSSAKLPGFAANTFRNNAGVGVRVPDHLVSALDVESSYVTGNGASHIDVYGSGISSGTAHTWRAVGVPIRFTGTTTIFGALTLSPGLTVRFGPSASWTISGSLTAVGTAAAPIQLVGDQPTRGYWDGLRFNSDLNELTHVTVAYAGGGTGDQAAIVVDGFDRLRLTHTVVEQSAGIGLLAGSSAKLPGFAANTFRNNAGVGVRVPDHLVSALDVESSYVTGNGASHIDVYGSGISNGTAHTWRALGVPIRFTGTTTIFGALTLSPGLTVRFGPSASWSVSGSLTAVGTAAAPIQLLGDQATPGYWDGIRFLSNSTANELTFVTVAHGGGGTGSRANVFVDAFDQLRLTNSTIRDSSGWGLFVEGSGTVTPTPVSGTNVFSNNALGATNLP